jgi:hypothetical protein
MRILHISVRQFFQSWRLVKVTAFTEWPHPERVIEPGAVTARKDDAPAADQAAITNVVGWMVFSGGGGLIQTTSG